MSRAFLAAGSRGVIASLWPVDSAATEALIVQFYRHHRSGIDPGRALRLAKRAVAKTDRWRHPYYWSAFVLVAEGGLLEDADMVQPVPTAEVEATDAAADTPDRDDPTRGLDVEITGPKAPPPGTFADDYQVFDPFSASTGAK